MAASSTVPAPAVILEGGDGGVAAVDPEGEALLRSDRKGAATLPVTIVSMRTRGTSVCSSSRYARIARAPGVARAAMSAPAAMRDQPA